MKFFYILVLVIFNSLAYAQTMSEDQPCFKECRKGTEKPACLKCLNANPDLYKLDENVFGVNAQPCFAQCKDGLESNGCALCIIKNPKTFRLGTKSNDLSDCEKSDDLKSIICPDGKYVKDSSVVDSMRDTPSKEVLSDKTEVKFKRNSVSGQ